MKQSNYDEFKSFLNSFGHGLSFLECSLHDASYDETNKEFVYSASLPQLMTISFDSFCNQVYRNLHFSSEEFERLKNDYDNGLKASALNIASADSFLIDKDGNWFLLEFKNQKVEKSKESAEKKAYQNFFWLCDLVYTRRGIPETPVFSFENPIEFARNKITYILIVSDEKNMTEYQKMHLLHLSNQKYRTLYLEKLRHYVFFDAYAMTAQLFAKCFVSSFRY